MQTLALLLSVPLCVVLSSLVVSRFQMGGMRIAGLAVVVFLVVVRQSARVCLQVAASIASVQKAASADSSSISSRSSILEPRNASIDSGRTSRNGNGSSNGTSIVVAIASSSSNDNRGSRISSQRSKGSSNSSNCRETAADGATAAVSRARARASLWVVQQVGGAVPWRLRSIRMARCE
jgi:hypothetical protein